jgi:SEC-C motif
MSEQKRNAPCACGSGRKYKHCHGKLASPTDDSRPSSDVLESMRRQMDSINAAEYRRRLMHGLGRPIVSFETNGFRIVAIGTELRWSKNWKKFADFLMDYIKATLTPQWGNAEVRKPTLEMHPVIRWFKHIGASIANARSMAINASLRETTMDGTARAFLGLAYDLFLCAHNVKTQELLIKRLRKKPTFGGALYEANVIGWFIRAGFTIVFEDESDPNSTHCEFVATHSVTGKKFSVEAKTIGDDSSRAGDSSMVPRVRHKLTEALMKRADHDRVVFIDLNRAEHPTDGAPPAWEKRLHEEITQCEQDLKIGGAPAPPAYVFMTNRGYLYRLHEQIWAEFAIVDGFKIPDFPIGKGCTTVLQMHRARERNFEMYWLTQALVTGTPIPQTFDARSPEEAYSSAPIARIRIGDTIEYGQEGEKKSGVLEDAHVNEHDKNFFAMLKTDLGHIFATVPLTEVELAIYRSNPDTFFDVVKPINKPLTKPLELFDFFARSYMDAKKETLLDWMKEHPDVESFQARSQKELAEIYCDRMATAMWHREKQSQATKLGEPTEMQRSAAEHGSEIIDVKIER